MMHEFDHLLHYIKPLLPISTTLDATGAMEENIRCILFDIYGTLFISASGDISIVQRQSQQGRYFKKLLHKYHLKKDPQTLLNEFFSAIDGEHERLKIEGVDFPEVEIEKIWAKVLEIEALDTARAFAMEFEMIVNPVYPMPNLEKMLSACRQSNMQMGIISNAQFFTPYLFDWFFDSAPEDLGFNGDLIFYSYKTGHAKPSTAMFESAAGVLSHMDIPSYSVLYIGNDMLNDIFPAQRTGFKTALFAGDARSLRLREDHPECRNLAPDIVVTDLVQLLKYTGREQRAKDQRSEVRGRRSEIMGQRAKDEGTEDRRRKDQKLRR
jgi:putative hydrolase of the HAD superfamily